MSVLEMGRMLGLKKVESYWLLHKEYFQVVRINGKMRVVISSFEDWYRRQDRYCKVSGEPPGDLLREESLSAADVSEMLGISESYVYEVMEKAGIAAKTDTYRKRYPREEFEKWYAGQSRYCKTDRMEGEASLIEVSLSMPDMARLLDVPRNIVYSILQSEAGRKQLQVFTYRNRKRITKESFEKWYAGQTEYLKPEDRPGHPEAKDLHYADCLKWNASGGKRGRRRKGGIQKPKNVSTGTALLTQEEAAYLGRVDVRTVRRWIREKQIPTVGISSKAVRIPRLEYEQFLSKKAQSERRNS